MKILVVCQYYYPESFQINDICEQLVKDGNSVTVLTGLPNYPSGIVPEEYKHGKKREETIHGVRIIRCFEIGRKKGALCLGLNYLSYCLSAAHMAKILALDIDIIYVYQLSPVLMAYPGVVLKKKLQKPLFLYCCDIWPESMKILRKSEHSIAFKITKRISTWLYQKCDRIAVQSTAFFSYFQNVHGIPGDKLCYIPQYANGEYLEQDFSHPPHQITNFVFLGNMGIAQDIDCIISAVEKIRNFSNFKVHFVGDGSFLNRAKQVVSEKKLDDLIVFYGRRPTSEMPYFYQMADACLLTLNADHFIGLTIPSKLQGYMAAGKPVIGAISGPAKKVIEEAQCGLCVEASDCEGLSQIMKEFLMNTENYRACGFNGREYFVAHFSKELYMANTEYELQNLLR